MGNNNQRQATNKTEYPSNQTTQTAIQTTNTVSQHNNRLPIPVTLTDKYEIGDAFARGAYTILRNGTNKATGEQVVMKYIPTRCLYIPDIEFMKRKFDSIKGFQHPNVIKYLDLFDLGQELVLVMEHANAGDLFSHLLDLSDKGAYTELEARKSMFQIVEGVNALYQNGISFQEIKPKYILCHKTDQGTVVKMTHYLIPDSYGNSSVLATTICAVPDFAAPEVLRMEGPYPKSGVWSIGVIAFIILCGYPPFYGETQARLFEKILNVDFEFADHEWNSISTADKLRSSFPSSSIF